MDVAKVSPLVSTVPEGIGDAVGMDETQWYVAIVNNNSEKKISQCLEKEGIENYVPIQKELRLRKDGKKVAIDRVVISSVVFIRCTESQRRVIVRLPYIKRFMTNKAGGGTKGFGHPLAIIPDEQMSRLKFMLGESETPVTITNRPLKKGDIVKVVRGKLTGLVGEIMNLKNDRSELIVTLDYFGCARLKIDTINVEKIK